MEYLRRGGVIVTDTHMACSGVSRATLERLGGRAVCYMADPDIAQEARRRGTTRALVSMERAVAADPQAILAVGNAPTALLKIAQLLEEGARPTLVIGVPVGFVNVVESKERLLDTWPPVRGARHRGSGPEGGQHCGRGHLQRAFVRGGGDPGTPGTGVVTGCQPARRYCSGCIRQKAAADSPPRPEHRSTARCAVCAAGSAL